MHTPTDRHIHTKALPTESSSLLSAVKKNLRTTLASDGHVEVIGDGGLGVVEVHIPVDSRSMLPLHDAISSSIFIYLRT